MTLPRTREDLVGRRCARWVRESTKGQYDRYGPDAQRALQDADIRRLALVDTGIFWEAKQSGRTVYQSDEMGAMVAAARDGRFDVLVVAYVARWQRNLRRFLEILEDVLHPLGVVVWFCDEELLSSRDRDWDALVDEAKAADSWLRRHARRVKEGLEAKRLRHRDPGGHPPLGFCRAPDTKLMEPDPATLDTVRQAFMLSASGVTDREVGARLGLTVHTVRSILTSPLYIGRLRDGGPANWAPVISIDLWNRVQVTRAGRATTAGRPASPRRPYALAGRIRCAACGRRLIGDTGYYRHDDVCPAFAAATPTRPPGWHGRRDGKGYRREDYEATIEKLLDMVALGGADIARVVGAATATATGPDRLALKRIEQERDAALRRVDRDRDFDGLRATLERLDREEAAARAPRPAEGVPANEVVAYLRALGRTWRKADGGPGRAMLVRALFEDVQVLGFREMRVRLTPEAIAHGFADAIPERLELTVGYGRGERI